MFYYTAMGASLRFLLTMASHSSLLNSFAFLGHTTSQTLIHVFEVELQDLNLKKLLQISMDGPNVNVKFFKDLQKNLF